MPGVTITTAIRTGAASPVQPAGAQLFLAGITERGPAGVPVRCRGMAEYVAGFGDRTSYGTLYDAARTYFEEGGVQAFITRVVGTAATKGSVTLVDRAAVTPVSTLKIEAANVGAWSTRVTVTVTDGSATGRYSIRILLDGAEVETYLDLSSPADAVGKLAASRYVRGIDQSSATVAPNNNPANVTAVAVTAGDDDRATLVADDMVTALATFGPEYGDGSVALPGYTVSQVGAGILTHCEDNRRVGLLAVAAGQSESQVKAAAAALSHEALQCGALIYPHVIIPDGSARRTVSPETFAAAVRDRAIIADGSWRVPAGTDIAEARFIVDVERVLSQTTGDDLNDNRVSVIRTIGLVGPAVMYGWRSLSLDADNWYFLSVRDLLNRVETLCAEELQRFTFSTIDAQGKRISDLRAALLGRLEPLRVAGAFAEENDRGYTVDVGPSVNTPDTLRARKLRAVVVVRPAGSAESVELTVVRATLGSAL